MIPADALATARTFLFVPGSRPDRFKAAHASGADVVIIDLEDAVPARTKGEAREAAVHWLMSPRSRPTTIVRVNSIGTREHDADIAAVAATKAPIMLPKTESATQLSHVRQQAPESPLIPLVETPRGIQHIDEIAEAKGVVRLAFGHIDLAAALGVDPEARLAFLRARTDLVLASAAAEIAPPVDGVTTGLDDEDRLRDDVKHAVVLGMGGKLCIHPRQVGPIHEALRPTPAEIEWASKVVDSVGDGGAVAVAGEMIDPPVVARAQRLLLRASV